jgi:hypothetical protein
MKRNEEETGRGEEEMEITSEDVLIILYPSTRAKMSFRPSSRLQKASTQFDVMARHWLACSLTERLQGYPATSVLRVIALRIIKRQLAAEHRSFQIRKFLKMHLLGYCGGWWAEGSRGLPSRMKTRPQRSQSGRTMKARMED